MKPPVVVKLLCFISQYSEQHKEGLNTDFMHGVPQLTNAAFFLSTSRVASEEVGVLLHIRVQQHATYRVVWREYCRSVSRKHGISRMNMSFHFSNVAKSLETKCFNAISGCDLRSDEKKGS